MHLNLEYEYESIFVFIFQHKCYLYLYSCGCGTAGWKQECRRRTARVLGSRLDPPAGRIATHEAIPKGLLGRARLEPSPSPPTPPPSLIINHLLLITNRLKWVWSGKCNSNIVKMSMEWFRFFMDWMRVVYTCLFVASAPIALFDVFV